MEDEIEKTDVQEHVDDVHADLAAAMKELDGNERGEDGKFVAKEQEAEEKETEAPVELVKEIPPAPQSLSAEEKAEWANLSDKARDIIARREQDYHKEFTRQDSERLFGRDLKEVITPYMAAITAAGSTPKETVGNLLNTVYRLQNGDESTRTAIVKQIAKDYGVKLEGLTDGEEYIDPTIATLQNEIRQLRELANPQALISKLTEQQEAARIESDIKAFASNPEHVHFESVRPLMTALITSGQAKDLKEAYDMACYANPTIRSTLEAKKAAEQQAKRKQEIEAKKRAASSVTGSPATPSNSKVTNPKSSVEDDLRAVMDELESRV